MLHRAFSRAAGFGGTLVLWLLLQGCHHRKPADLIVYNAVIYTCDSAFSVQQAMALKNGRLLATGTTEDIRRRYAADSLLDVGGKWIYPGFIDAHCHFTGYATDLWKCSLYGTASWEEVLERVKAYAAAAPTEWIYGRGWDQNDWPLKQFPDKTELDRLFPHRPVLLKRIDGHAVVVNQRALDLAGITARTRIPGGRIELRNGQLTGILLDAAMDAVEKMIPPIADTLARRYLRQTQDSCFRYGLTGVHDCGVGEGMLALLERMQAAGELRMKVYALLHDSAQYYASWTARGPYRNGRIHVGGFKVYADGALGSRGACLLHPYHDDPAQTGFMISDAAHLRQVAERLIGSGLQLCTHAIGDSANRTVLNVYADVLKGPNDRRWRIEHAQVVNRADIPLFGRYSIIPSVQPVHATSDMYWAGDRLGADRLPGAYAYRSLLQQNGWLPLGTDFPVEALDPLRTFYAAVWRRDLSGYPEGGFRPDEALDRRSALLGMTRWAARAAFEEQEKGSLEPGKAADFIWMDTDLLQAPAPELPKALIRAVFVDGHPVYRR